MKALAKLGKYSVDYYQQKIKQSNPSENYALIDCDFAAINAYLPDQYESLQTPIVEFMAEAHKQGITRLLLPNITLHLCFYLFPEWLQGIKLYDPFELLKNVLRDQSVCILGSRHMQESVVLNERLQQANLDLVKLDVTTLTKVDEIRKAIYFEGCLPEHREAMNEIAQILSQQYTVVIACTELSIALSDLSGNIIDLAELQIAAFLADVG